MEPTTLSVILHKSTDSSSSNTSQRIWHWLFWALLLLYLAPFWIFQYFPSQDGPAHLHNAAVLAHYGTETAYRQYYLLNLFPASGNILTQFVLASFLQFGSILLAQKLLLSLYVVLLFVSFRYFLSSFTPYAVYFAVLAAILAPSSFLYMGFWNFCLSIPLALLVLGYYQRHRNSWTPLSLLVLLLGGVTVYLSHAISWAVCVLAVAILGFQISAERNAKDWVRTTVLRYVLPLFALLPPGVFMLAHLLQSQEQSMCVAETSLRKRLWFLYSLSFLQTIATSDHMILVKGIAAALLATTLFVAALLLWRKQYVWGSTGLLAISLGCGLITVFGPECLGTGSYIRVRLAFYACLFFMAWLSSALREWPRRSLNVIAGVFFAIAVTAQVASVPVLSKWNRRLSEVAATGQYVHPGSTVLLVNLQEPREGPENPYLHVTGLLSSQAVVDIRNYEATSEFFMTRFRPDRSPFPALGTLHQLESSPADFDIGRFENSSRGRVDYVLFLLDRDSGTGEAIDSLIAKRYAGQIGSYSEVPLADKNNQAVRLYQHNAVVTDAGTANRGKLAH